MPAGISEGAFVAAYYQLRYFINITKWSTGISCRDGGFFRTCRFAYLISISVAPVILRGRSLRRLLSMKPRIGAAEAGQAAATLSSQPPLTLLLSPNRKIMPDYDIGTMQIARVMQHTRLLQAVSTRIFSASPLG